MSYGFEAYKGDSTTLISSTNGVARIIYSSDRSQTFSGQISVPEFDSNLGYYSFKMYPLLHIIAAGQGSAPLPENTSFTQNGGLFMPHCYSRGPTLSWDNSTKILTVTANSQPQDFFNQVIRYRYRIIMVHYK